MTLYLDNAATSHPKPATVYAATLKALEELGVNPGRGAHRLARSASELVDRTRNEAASFLGIADHKRLHFTKNATESINIVLKGWLRANDRVLVSPLEHNAVTRPLQRLEKDLGVEMDTIPGAPDGLIDLNELRTRLTRPTRLVVVCHGSNVTGLLQPVPEIARICSERGVPILVDAAQTAGLQDIDADAWGLDMLACSGHKAMLGPPGTGLLYIRPGLEVRPLLEGGTGSRSESFEQPAFHPDCHESGTPNLPGIAGLGSGIAHIREHGRNNILQHELALAEQLQTELAQLPGARVLIPSNRGTGTVSLTIDGMNPADVGQLLDQGFDIAVRTGLHCAPLAHRTLGTLPEGTIRVSPGYNSTADDMEYFVKAIRSLLSRRSRGIGRRA